MTKSRNKPFQFIVAFAIFIQPALCRAGWIVKRLALS
jgi:hypothetical protein